MPDNGELTPRCGNCRFWIKAPANRLDLSDVRGDCRRHPPQVTIIHIQSGQGVQIGGQSSQFPSLPANFPNCGEYLPVEPKLELT